MAAADEDDAKPVREVRLRNGSGMSASVVTWGAALRDLVVPVGAGHRRVVLGFEDPEAYRGNPSNLGVIAGRCANRIAGGRFTLDGREYRLPLNEQERTHLHGGPRGFARQPWRLVAADEGRAVLGLTSPDGDQGYPGRVEATCTYSLTAPSTLRVELCARTTAATLVNLVQHSYFALAEGASARDHVLSIEADSCTPTDAHLIPTGEIAAVADTDFDFRKPRRVGQAGRAYDLNFALRSGGGPLALAARVVAPTRDLAMQLWTTEPGLQLYDGAYLKQGGAPGIGGQRHGPHAGLCLEPQRFPDAVNHLGFPSPVLRPGEEYRQITEYRFSVPG